MKTKQLFASVAGCLAASLLQAAWPGREVMKVASDGASNDNFGISTAVSGNYAAVGAWAKDVAGKPNAGAVYIFERNAGGADSWGQVARLDGRGAGDHFGISVAISGNRLIVGAYSNALCGSAYIFERNPAGVWQQMGTRLRGFPARSGDRFGTSVAIDGDLAVVGAYRSDSFGIRDSGAAFVFRLQVKEGLVWDRVAMLTQAAAAAADEFGISVAVSGAVVAVGAWGDEVAGQLNGGSVSIFEPTNGLAWSTNTRPSRKIVSRPGPLFGRSLALEGDKLFVGAQGGGRAPNSGVVHLFERKGNEWKSDFSPDFVENTAPSHYGLSISFEGDSLLIGAPGTGLQIGRAYLYKLTDGIWSTATRIAPNVLKPATGFGMAVANTANTLLVGAFQRNTAAGAKAGAAYLFLPPTNSPPVASPASFTLLEDGVISTSVGMNDPDNDALSAVKVDEGWPVTLNANGSFWFAPPPDYFGTNWFTFYATDGELASDVAMVNLEVRPVNDPPVFTGGPNEVVRRGDGQRIFTNWAQNMSSGAANEWNQFLTFQVVVLTNAQVFAVTPFIDGSGSLFVTPSATLGTALLRVTLSDDGGTDNGGRNTSDPQFFMIEVQNAITAPLSPSPFPFER